MKYLIIISTLFVSGSLLGYVLEVFYRRFFSQHKWMNPGFMVGPYIPLYGFGVVILYALSNIDFTGIQNQAVEVIIKILLIGVMMTLIELIAGLIFIRGLNLKLWDYSDRWGNFKGVICPLFSLIWLVVGTFYFFLINPYFVDLIEWISENIIYSYFIGLVIGMMLVDFAYSLHIGVKLKKIGGKTVYVLHELKDFINNKFKAEYKEKQTFSHKLSILNSSDKLSSYLHEYHSNLKTVKQWWKKNKENKKRNG